MNRGVFQSSPVQQIMGGSPSWWNNMRPPPQQAAPFLPSSSSASPVFPQYSQQSAWQENQDLPESWSQLLLGGVVGEEDRCGLTPFQAKKMESWEEQLLFQSMGGHMVDVKQEPSENGYVYRHENEEISALRSAWGQILPVSSPRSCVTSLSSNVLDFSTSKLEGRRKQIDHSSECNSTANGTAAKKARVQAASSSTHTTFKVRKEKLGDRITALHQLVSPFGKTDTASVLLEAIGYIRFLQSQIEALCSPYLGNGSGNVRQQSQQQQQQPAQGERSCIFPEDPGQLLNDACLKRRGSTEKDADQDGPKKDLRSRGLCLVPVSCTLHVGNDTGADFWAPSLGAGFR